jgi:hypothetical protein
MSRNVSEVPVEIITNNKKGDIVWTDIYTITRFRTDNSVDPDFWTVICFSKLIYFYIYFILRHHQAFIVQIELTNKKSQLCQFHSF